MFVFFWAFSLEASLAVVCLLEAFLAFIIRGFSLPLSSGIFFSCFELSGIYLYPFSYSVGALGKAIRLVQLGIAVGLCVFASAIVGFV